MHEYYASIIHSLMFYTPWSMTNSVNLLVVKLANKASTCGEQVHVRCTGSTAPCSRAFLFSLQKVRDGSIRHARART